MEIPEKIAVIGLGYVGLPLALGLSKYYPGTIGFDINQGRIFELQQGYDRNQEVKSTDILNSSLKIIADSSVLALANFFIVTAPTPIDANNYPDLQPLRQASELVGKFLSPGAIAVYESTVYPGITETFCGPILAAVSGLRLGIDFHLGYSPERINPGDPQHRLENVIKVVAASDTETLARIATVYRKIVPAGIYCAPSIRVAEAGKVIENIQRDLNIALMNELAIIFERLGLRTADVLAVAQTKWNFIPFQPGLVGGHCIGVDPYYLTAIAQQHGYHPEIILAGRRINDSMGSYLGQRLVKLLSKHLPIPLNEAKVGILGITFKENVRDLRNSRVPDLVRELQAFGINPLIHDPLVDSRLVEEEYQLNLTPWSELYCLDALVLAVIHREYLVMPQEKFWQCLNSPGIFLDIKSAFSPQTIPQDIIYSSL